MNVILYVVDSLRADHVHALGYGRETTPNLDRLAREGAVFELACSQSGWTAPSAASLLSSRHPSATGIRRMHEGPSKAIPWLPERLREEGFRTAAFSSVAQLGRHLGFDRGFDDFRELFLEERTLERCRARAQASRGDHYCLPLSEDLHLEALEWLDGRDAARRREPFFLLLWSIDVHEPYRHSGEFDLFADPAYRGPIDGRGRPFSRVRDRRDLRQLVDLYDGSIRHQDARLGELVESLEERGLLDDTLLIVCADHGEMLFEHGIAGHGKYPWEPLMRVPLVLRHPPTIEAGRRIGALVQLIDLAPSILELAGAAPQERFRGRSLAPLLSGEAQRIHEVIALEEPYPFDPRERAVVVRDERWKYVEYTPPAPARRLRVIGKELGRALSLLFRPAMAPVLHGHRFRGGPREWARALVGEPLAFAAGRRSRRLFDLADDPDESRDRMRSAPEVAARLRAAMELVGASAEGAGPVADADRRVKEQLRDLGYLE